MAPESKIYDKYPISTVIVVWFIILVVYVVSAYIVFQIGNLWGWLYIVYLIGMEIMIYKEGCVICCYYGKRCFSGRGLIVAKLFKAGDPRKFCQKKITWKNLYAVLYESLKTLAIVAALITTSSAYGYMMTRLDIPRIVTESLIHLTDNRYLIFLIVNVILLFLGMIMDMAPLILITTPILLPVVANFGMEPHHFGIVMMINLGMGLLTPPVGSTLFVGCAIGRIRIEDMVKPLIPFYVTMFITLMLITYIPQISLRLPSLVGR